MRIIYRKLIAIFCLAAIIGVSSSFGTSPVYGAEKPAPPSTSAEGLPSGDQISTGVFGFVDESGESIVSGALDFIEPLVGNGIKGLFKEVEIIDCPPGCTTAQYFRITPILDLNAGDNGAFQAIVGKISGEFMFTNVGLISTETDEGPVTFRGPVGVRHIFPIAFGAETTRFGESYALLGEVGYVPFHPNLGGFGGQKIQLGYNPYFGVFFQTGYKFDGSGSKARNGSKDESSEPTDDEIIRAKASFRFTYDLPELPMFGETLAAKFITAATGWYDIAHDDIYYAASAILRFSLPGTKKTSFDLKVEHGSGEPNFNQGTQFGTGLNITF